MNKILNKKILAHNGLKREFIGIIYKITCDYVYINNKNNPLNYQNYKIKLTDFKKWITEKNDDGVIPYILK